MKKITDLISGVSSVSGWLANLSALLLVLLICADVTARYLFNVSTPALFELEWHLFSFIFLLGASYGLSHDRHVRVDVFYQHFSEKKKAWINLIGTSIFLIPFCLIVMRSSIPYVEISWLMSEKSTDPGGLPFRFIIKSLIPIGFGLLLLQAIGTGLENLRKILAEKDIKDPRSL